MRTHVPPHEEAPLMLNRLHTQRNSYHWSPLLSSLHHPQTQSSELWSPCCPSFLDASPGLPTTSRFIRGLWFFIFFFNPHPMICLLIWGVGEWNIDVREKYQYVASWTCTGNQTHDLGWVPWLGIEPTTFWCMGWCSNQQSNTVRAGFVILLWLCQLSAWEFVFGTFNLPPLDNGWAKSAERSKWYRCTALSWAGTEDKLWTPSC